MNTIRKKNCLRKNLPHGDPMMGRSLGLAKGFLEYQKIIAMGVNGIICKNILEKMKW